MSEKSKVKDSNELLNILMIIIGGLFILMGILNVLAWAGISVGFDLSNPAIQAALTILGPSGLLSIVLGVWCLVSGIGMFREEEYAMGMGLVVLSSMAVQTLSIMLSWISIEWWTNWINYIILIAFIIGVAGFFWLIFTYKRYN
ncbi:unnamed protein product [marine sediment metagenome]|uniref:Uncharacterized protein n=1 Tax=marine sediment metagenome TaxID=412755 RepID=X1B9D4_9ZZZZ